MKLRDVDLRRTLNEKFSRDHRNDPETIVINELGLCQGISRIDIAVINGFIHGYEIKSEKDNLDRLESQIEIYNKVCDEVTIVTCDNHKDKISAIVPEWWGISVASNKRNKIKLAELRSSKQNPSVDSYSVAQLLWRDEALDILKKFDLDKGMLSKARKEIWLKLSTHIPIDELKKHIRDKIKVRANWRSVHIPT